MNRDDFVVFFNSDTGIKESRIISWLPGDETLNDANGNPMRTLDFTVQGNVPVGNYIIRIRDPKDVKRFLASVWSQSDLVMLLLQACEQAADWIDAEYNDGDVNDTRLHWGDCPDLDALYNQLHQAVALAKGEPFTPRE